MDKRNIWPRKHLHLLFVAPPVCSQYMQTSQLICKARKTPLGNCHCINISQTKEECDYQKRSFNGVISLKSGADVKMFTNRSCNQHHKMSTMQLVGLFIRSLYGSFLLEEELDRLFVFYKPFSKVSQGPQQASGDIDRDKWYEMNSLI